MLRSSQSAAVVAIVFVGWPCMSTTPSTARTQPLERFRWFWALDRTTTCTTRHARERELLLPSATAGLARCARG